MRIIDLPSWPRRTHFTAFNDSSKPHFSLTAELDLTPYYHTVKQRGLSLNIAIIYAVTRAANAVPQFRQRIRGETVVEHDLVHPSTTILAADDLFSFCTIEYSPDFPLFYPRAETQIAHIRQHPDLNDDLDRDDFLFMTAIPWVSFTAFVHPGHLRTSTSIPLFAWGKFTPENDLIKIPVAVTVHHAIIDGLHVGRFYEQLQSIFHHPDLTLTPSPPPTT